MIGRSSQIKKMHVLISQKKSSFLAVTGRRRVGKTHLVDEIYQKQLCLRVTGIQDANMKTQIVNFAQKLAEYSNKPIISLPQNWQELMLLLKTYLQSLSKTKKQVIFIDELPWVATKRSGFIQQLAHLWNDYLSKEKNFILVICGSATSWITKRVLNDKGGFHNRVTDHIKLRPFNLAETKEFLMSRDIRLTDQAITELYMVIGGIPYYLEQIKKGLSVSQIISQLCFSDDGILKYEYENLYKALFEHSENHEAIVATLAKHTGGLSRSDIILKSKVEAGGPYTRAMEDLLMSGFVDEIVPFGKRKRGATYRLMDEYSIFYHKFIFPNRKKDKDIWTTISNSQKYRIWTGFAFETVCHRHVNEIKNALGIAGVFTEHYSFRMKGDKSKTGLQIDLILDRKDDAINLCECKYYNDDVTISKDYATKLRQRRQGFIHKVGTKKSVFNTLITSYGITKNAYYHDVVDQHLSVSDLM